MQVLDYSRGYPGAAAIAAAGYGGAVRYLPKNGTSSVLPLTTAEYADYRAHGLGVALVYQAPSRDRILAGQSAGAEDARWALARAREIVGHDPRCIHFAADRDLVGPADFAAVLAYLDGATTVLGRDRVGVYGEFDIVEAAVPAHAAWAWQTVAWSRGRVSSKARLLQRPIAEQISVAGVTCDINDVLQPDWGQLMPTLVVQMGHVGRTTGNTGAVGEQEFAKAVAAQCVRLLDGVGGWQVRPIVADPPASQYQGDAFVAVHCDGSTNPNQRGASVGYQNAEGRALATAWAQHYRALGFDGPWHADNYTTNLGQYYGVRAAIGQGNRRACIVECGTITSPAERAVMDPERVARAIGLALGITTTQEDNDMTPDQNALLVKIANQVAGLDRAAGVTFASGKGMLGEVAMRIEAKVDAGFGALSDDEANIIAAVRAHEDAGAGEGMTDEQLQQLIASMPDAIVEGIVRLAGQREGGA